MRKITLLVVLASCLLMALPSQASHVAGAEIQYKYIGDSTGIPRHYLVILKLYRDISGIGIGPNENVTVTSSCWGNLNINMVRTNPPGVPVHPDGGILTPDLDECVSSNAPGFVTITQHIFRGTVTLPSNCPDIRFRWDLCCRNGAITNLVAPAGQSTYIEAFLNNMNGQNTSPQFVTPAAKAFCTNNYFVWSQASIEPNGDSVFYELAPAQTVGGGGGVNINYAAGYNAQQPLTTAFGTGGIQTDTKTGTFAFTTGAIQEVCVLVVLVKEFRFNVALATWEFVGSSVRDMQVVIAGQCKSSVQNGPKIDISAAGFGRDTIDSGWRGTLAGVKIANDSIVDPNSPNGYSYIVPTIGYNCADSTISLTFDVDLQCTSISPDGSEFRVIGPDSIPRPVIGVEANCGFTFQTRFIRLKLYRPLTVNGYYTLYIKEGNDGNTLMNKCGFPLQEFYTMLIKVDNCWIPSYDIKNVTVDTNFTIRVQYDLDTNSFPPALFDGVQIWRSEDNGATYQAFGSNMGLNALRDMQWTDFSVGPGEVESSRYRYKIAPIVNSETYNPGRDITSILLDTISTGDPEKMHLVWNRYNGWLNVNYRVMMSMDVKDSASWSLVTGMGVNPTIDSHFVYTMPADTGCYGLRVEAIRPNNTQYVSVSNWEQFCIVKDPDPEPEPEPEPEDPQPLEIPNVFTPNGDGANDLFVIKDIDTYTDAKLQVFNRWGGLVFESANYIYSSPWDGKDQNTGSALLDGTYFYVLTVKHTPTNKVETFTGTVNIFGGGLN